MIIRDLAADGEVPTSGVVVLDLGGPAPGKRWSARRVTIGPAIPGTPMSGTARLYIGVPPATPATTPPGADLRDETTTFPNPGPWGEWQLNVQHPMHLFATFAGSVGFSVALSASVEEVTDRAVA